MLWYKAKILPYDILSHSNIEEIRNNDAYPKLPNSGWHFSYLGGIDNIIRKIEYSPHQEFNTPDIKRGVPDNVWNCSDIFNRGIKFNKVLIDDTYPKFVLDNKDTLFKDWIKKI